jgi:acetyl-CoA carboxylase biotin carboxyl carrier protein
MDIKQIQELVKLVNKSNIGELSIEKDNFKITIKQKKEYSQNYTPSYPQQVQQAPQMQLPSVPSPVPVAGGAKPSDDAEKSGNLLTIKSPMIGTFYRQAGPGKPLFVSVGDEVEAGQVVCIIEAMKLFNEIESEVSGKIVKILVEDASPVEFDQPLFLVEP